MSRRSKPKYQIKIAKERIAILFGEARRAPKKLARRYVELARKIGMRYNVRLTTEQKRKFCGECGHYMKGRKGRHRAKKGVMTITCGECGRVMRYPYKPKKSKK